MSQMLDLNGYANMIIIAKTNFVQFDSLLKTLWKPIDIGLKIKKLDSNFVQITSERVFIEEKIAKSIQNVVPNCQSILTYLVNSISCKQNFTPYSFVTAANESFFSQKMEDYEILGVLLEHKEEKVCCSFILTSPLFDKKKGEGCAIGLECIDLENLIEIGRAHV